MSKTRRQDRAAGARAGEEAGQPRPAEIGDVPVIPAVVDGLVVMSAFRMLPAYGRTGDTWTVILREYLDPAAGNRYRVRRVREATAPARWIVIEDETGADSLAWTEAMLLFSRLASIEAAPAAAQLREERDTARRDRREHPHDDECPQCHRVNWSQADVPACLSCGYSTADPRSLLQEDRHLAREL